MAYIGSSPTKVVSRQSANIFTYTATANQTAFTGADANGNTLACSPSDLMVHMNGIKLEESDYTASTTTVTLGSGAAAGDEVTITAFLTFETADHYTKSVADARYYTQTVADTRYVNTSGDSMTGALSVSGGANSAHLTLSGSANRGLKISTSNPDGQNDGTVILNAQDTEASGVYAKMSFQTAGTERMKIDNAGRVTMPNQPCFRARGSNSWTTLAQANGVQVMNLGTEEFDQGGNYSTTTYRFTAPVAGKYFLRLHAYVRLETQDDDGNHAYAQIYKNNAGAGGNASIFGYHNNGDSDQMANVTTIMDMAANDFATAVLSPASGSSSYYGGATYFSGFLIG